MTKTPNLKILNTLASDDANPVLASLASILTSDTPVCHERLSVLIHQSVASGKPLTDIATALVDIDEAIRRKGGEVPFAVKLVPLAVELMLHAHAVHVEGTLQQDAAETAPIVPIGKRTLVATAGHLSCPSALARFSDRVLAVVLNQRIKRVLLQPPITAAAEVETAIQLLIDDLRASRVRVALIRQTDPKAP